MSESVKCVGDCGRMLRPKRALADRFPGTVPVQARGMCNRCYQAAYRAGLLEEVVQQERPVSFVRYFPQGDSFGWELVRGTVVGKDPQSWTVEVGHGLGSRRRVLERAVWQPTLEDGEEGAAIVILQAHSDVDDAAVEAAVEGRRVSLNPREREEVVRRLAGLNWSDREIADRLGIDKRGVLRIRSRAEIPAALGANGMPVAS